ncbi:MAG: hypothetical protein J6X55_13105 [Victivallales bacterium]|nr:hypothetical protein [Victivallales bacterium]
MRAAHTTSQKTRAPSTGEGSRRAQDEGTAALHAAQRTGEGSGARRTSKSGACRVQGTGERCAERRTRGAVHRDGQRTRGKPCENSKYFE